MKNQVKAYIFGWIVVLLWSTVASVFKLSLEYVTPVQLLFYSAVMSMIILFFTLVIQKKLKNLLELSFKNIVIMFIQGLLNPFLYFILLFKSYDLLPAQEAQPITYTWPIMMVLLAWPILKQKITLFDVITLFLCYMGIYVVITKGSIFDLHFSSVSGIIYALLSTIVWALYWIINTKVKTDPIITLFMNSVLSFPLIVFTTIYFSTPICSITGILGAFYVGAFEMGIAFVFWLYALKLAEKKTTIISLSYVSPVLSLLFIEVLTGERIIPATIVGICLIIAGLFVQSYKKNKKA